MGTDRSTESRIEKDHTIFSTFLISTKKTNETINSALQRRSATIKNMCRITGIVNLEKNRNSNFEEIIIKMRDSMAHGGPDDEGLYIDKDNGIALGHRRLSIIDLSPLGHQPMCTEDGNIWISYNGEVYNFLEIRKDLQALHYTFTSHSDTEVILKAYQEWGEEAFEKLNGMFAFCIYDRRKKLLYLVRDHAGIKPLYYSISNKHVIFSSEVKAFKFFNKDWGENKDWRIYFLIFGHMPEPFTTLENIFMLPKQSFLKLDVSTGKHEIKKYTDIPFTEDITDFNEAVGMIKSTFTKAVERHLISDAPIGVFLSGGIDSSLIALIAHKFKKDNLRTLSVVFNEKEFTEEKYQNIVLNKINSKHHSYLVTEKDFINSLDDIYQSMDQPTIDGVNTYFISKCAKEDGLKVVLSGLGGDELFGGYPSFARIDKLWFIRNLNENLRKPFKLWEYSWKNKFKKLSFMSIKNPISYYLLFKGIFSEKETIEMLNIGGKDVSNALERLHIKDNMSLGRKNFVSYLETNIYMQNQLLKDSDFMSMWHSVEMRVPFLDKEFMKCVFSISEKVKFNKNMSKYVLCKTFEDILPKEIIHRKKQGFTFPFDLWLKNKKNEITKEIISYKSIDKKHVERYWRKYENDKIHWSKIWSLVVIGISDCKNIEINKEKDQNIKSILIYRIGQLGDTICAIPAISAIKKAYPQSKITLLYDSHSRRKYPIAKDIVEGLHVFDKYISYDPPNIHNLKKLIKLLNRLQREKYDFLFYLMPIQRSYMQKLRDLIFFKVARVKKIIGFHNNLNSNLMHEADRLLNIVKQENIKIPDNIFIDLPIERHHIEKINRMWLKANISSSNPIIAIGPGSKMPVKRWPLERYKNVGFYLIKKYNAFLIILGGEEDKEIGEYLVNNWGESNSINCAGKTSYMESAEILRRCKFYIGNDTGTMHLAAAVGIRCIAIFSARDEKFRWYPYGSNHIVLRSDVSCQGCMLKECNKYKMKCILNISEAEVISAAENILKI